MLTIEPACPEKRKANQQAATQLHLLARSHDDPTAEPGTYEGLAETEHGFPPNEYDALAPAPLWDGDGVGGDCASLPSRATSSSWCSWGSAFPSAAAPSFTLPETEGEGHGSGRRDTDRPSLWPWTPSHTASPGSPFPAWWASEHPQAEPSPPQDDGGLGNMDWVPREALAAPNQDGPSGRWRDDPPPPPRSRTPLLHVAARNGHRSVMQSLLRHGVGSVDERWPRAPTGEGGGHGSGVTALHVAVESGYEAIVQLLLQHGADPAAVGGGDDENGNGMTALDLAVRGGHGAIVDLLLHHEPGVRRKGS